MVSIKFGITDIISIKRPFKKNKILIKKLYQKYNFVNLVDSAISIKKLPINNLFIYQAAMRIPILLFIFRRPRLTLQSLSYLKSIGVKKLFIICDGARENTEEQNLVAQSREVVSQFDFADMEVEKLYLEKNVGMSHICIVGLDWVFNKVEFVISHEEDHIPDSSFYNYCSILLDRYRHIDSVKLITGFNFFTDKQFSRDDYFFTNFPSFWGFAMWKRVWLQMDPDLIHKHSIEEISEILFRVAPNKQHFNYLKNLYNYWRKGDRIGADQKILYNIWALNGLSVVSTKNLVKNIGINREGAGSQNVRKEILKLKKNSASALNLKHHPTILSANKNYDFSVMSKIFVPDSPILKKITNKISLLFTKHSSIH